MAPRVPFAGTLLAALVCLAALAAPGVASAEPISLTVDASGVAGQNVVFARERVPVPPGPLTLYYPKWIPGEHGPVGPIGNFAGLVVRGGGAVLPWARDPVDLYAFHVTVPPGVDHLDVSMTYLGAPFGNYSSNRLASSNLGVIVWDQSLLYPSTLTMRQAIFRPTVILPDGWKFATALTGARRDGNAVTFDDVSLEHLVDSPLDMGENYRRWTLWSQGGNGAYLNAFADTPEELAASDAVVGHYRKLVREMLAMYGARHWRDYNFLLTLSDVIPGEGIEHHESSDDGAAGNYLTDAPTLDKGADLLSHEFNHSWDGKYRMPAGLYQPNLQMPYDDSLLWVYEGMTQYYGNVMSWRDGIRDAQYWPDHVAATYAYYDNEPGRNWRSLLDTAVSGPFLYATPRLYGAQRRQVDFYSEGELMWLKADSIIREKTNGRESLDTFAKAFFGGRDTGPEVVTYTRDDVVDGLNAVVPYDWNGFFATWVDAIAVHPPDGFTAGGWKLVYTDQPQHFVQKGNFWYSIGINVDDGGHVTDVRFGSPAWKAGVGVLTQIAAVNGRGFSADVLYDALVAAKSSNASIRLLLERTDTYREVDLAYRDGPRYPHLVRIEGVPDRLSEVVKPLAAQ